MPIINEKQWNEFVTENQDAYGGCCVNVAKEVMRMLDENVDVPIVEDYGQYSTHWYICQADDNINAGGITGFMASAVASMVSRCHSRGSEFRKMWNISNQIMDESEKANEAGTTLNTAVLNVKIKDD